MKTDQTHKTTKSQENVLSRDAMHRRKLINYASLTAIGASIGISPDNSAAAKGEDKNNNTDKKNKKNAYQSRVRFTENFFIDSIGNNLYIMSAKLEAAGKYRKRDVPIVAEFGTDKHFQQVVKRINLTAEPKEHHLIKCQFDLPYNNIIIYSRMKAMIETGKSAKREASPRVIYSEVKEINPWKS
ncbi:MAG: hypothetical protein QM569_12875 [Acidovorax sp.]|uniref:hypothetical protein n=1 Tax=Acidovorax sp. TaxID=1872122 RepID=UPI0039E6CA85